MNGMDAEALAVEKVAMKTMTGMAVSAHVARQQGIKITLGTAASAPDVERPAMHGSI